MVSQRGAIAADDAWSSEGLPVVEPPPPGSASLAAACYLCGYGCPPAEGVWVHGTGPDTGRWQHHDREHCIEPRSLRDELTPQPDPPAQAMGCWDCRTLCAPSDGVWAVGSLPGVRRWRHRHKSACLPTAGCGGEPVLTPDVS